LLSDRIGDSLVLSACTQQGKDVISGHGERWRGNDPQSKELLVKYNRATLRDFIDLMAVTSEADDSKWEELL
jgi:hypothetical protein